MKPSEKSNKIIESFWRYVKTGDKSLIINYSLEELKLAKYQYSADSDREFYHAIEDRIKELERIKEERNRIREKRLDRAITFILGVALGLVIAYLKGYFKLG